MLNNPITEKNKLEEILIKKTIESLEKNYFETVFVSSGEEALSYLIDLIDKKAKIGYGGSRTLEEINFFEHFTPEKYPNILDRRKSGLSFEDRQKIQRDALTSDYFICSANGISESGEIVLIDKWGNRNGAATYGPAKRIFIIGKNKITRTLPEAIERAKNTASVLNNIRFETKNPCTKIGKCVDCNSDNRICSVTTIISRCYPPKSILVLIVNEDLGF